MIKREILYWSIFLFAVFILSACTSQGVTSQEDQVSDQMIRPQPPSEFKNIKNPLSSTKGDIAKGKETYHTNCVSCHGENGMGDGVLAGSLDPKPLPFPLESVGDAYLYWRISEGGMREPFNSVMPAWNTILSDEQIWEIILYLRAL
jgi:mono/diheme cytochrome c family protein